MNFLFSLRNLFNPLQNSELIVYNFCRLLNVPVTKTYIREQIEGHPDYPSLLSISDVLKTVGVDNVSIVLKTEKINRLETPVLAQVEIKHKKEFTIIRSVGNKEVTFFDPVGQRYDTIARDKFAELFTGVVLLTEIADVVGEKNYSDHRKAEKRALSNKVTAGLALPVFTIFILIISFFTHPADAIYPSIYTLLTLAGTAAASLLLWYEIDQHNPTLQQICSGGAKLNCKAILNSPASKVFGTSVLII